MNPRLPLLAACAAAVLTVPTAASAASTTIVAGPLKVKNYSMQLTASNGGGSDSLAVIFSRSAGKASQQHMYSFTQGVDVSGTRVKADLGRFGRIDMKLALGAARKGEVPKGCTGTAGRMRSGALKGTFRLVADSTYFNTITAKSLKTSKLTGGTLDCAGTGGGGGQRPPSSTVLTSTQDGPAGLLLFNVTRTAGAVSQQVVRSDDAAATAPASVSHFIVAPGGGSAFDVAAGLASASGSGVSPFLTGSYAFAGEAMDNMTVGTLTGDLVARFDSIGAQPLAAGSPDAMLMST